LAVAPWSSASSGDRGIALEQRKPRDWTAAERAWAIHRLGAAKRSPTGHHRPQKEQRYLRRVRCTPGAICAVFSCYLRRDLCTPGAICAVFSAPKVPVFSAPQALSAPCASGYHPRESTWCLLMRLRPRGGSPREPVTTVIVRLLARR
jgi:hypothetical protein